MFTSKLHDTNETRLDIIQSQAIDSTQTCYFSCEFKDKFGSRGLTLSVHDIFDNGVCLTKGVSASNQTDGLTL